MATRLYFPSTGAAPVTPAAWQFAATVAAPDTFAGSRTRSGTAPATVAGATGTTSPVHRGVLRYVYGPLQGQSISGTVKAQMRCSENNAGANATLAMAIKLIQPNGSNRSTLLAQTASDSTSTPPEMATTLVNRRLLNTSETTPHTLTTQTATAGDYLVVEIGFRSATTTSRTISFRNGNNNASDLGENDTDSTDLNPWIEFSANLAFVEPPVEGSGTSALTLATTGVGRSLRSGLGVVALVLGAVAAGQAIHSGSSTAAVTLGLSGAGEAPAVPAPEGFGVSTVTLAAEGTGSAARSGAGAASLTLGASGVGRTIHTGSGSSTITLGAGGVGAVVHRGEGASPLTLGASGAGSALHSGDGTAPLTLADAGSGATVHRGIGTAALTMQAVGVGTAPSGVPEGAGAIAFVLDTAGAGARSSRGDGSVSLSLTTAGDGHAAHDGEGSSALVLGVVGVGGAPPAAPIPGTATLSVSVASIAMSAATPSLPIAAASAHLMIATTWPAITLAVQSSEG